MKQARHAVRVDTWLCEINDLEQGVASSRVSFFADDTRVPNKLAVLKTVSCFKKISKRFLTGHVATT